MPNPDPETNPGDEAKPGTPGTGKDVCQTCHGSGGVDAGACETCGGSGKVIRVIESGGVPLYQHHGQLRLGPC